MAGPDVWRTALSRYPTPSPTPGAIYWSRGVGLVCPVCEEHRHQHPRGCTWRPREPMWHTFRTQVRGLRGPVLSGWVSAP